MMRTLPYLGALLVRGDGAPAFLDAQLTQKVSALAPGDMRLAAWCDPQGRVRALFRVLRAPDGGFALVLPQDLAEATCRALARFILRAPVAIDADVAAVFDASAVSPGERAGFAHGAHAQDPTRPLGVAQAALAAAAGGQGGPATGDAASQAWRAADIRAGMPQVFAASSGLWLPQHLDLGALGGLSYDKGCYPGQEVIARLHYRGTVKQTLCRLASRNATGSALPLPGAALTDASGTRVGEVVDAVATAGDDAQALAVVDTSATGVELFADDAAGSAGHWHGLPVRALDPPGKR